MQTDNDRAPGHPGIPPRWTSSAKSGVGTAAAGVAMSGSPFPTESSTRCISRISMKRTRVIAACLITDGAGFFSEEKRHTTCQVRPLVQGVPGYQLTNTCVQERYRVHKLVLTDPRRDVLLQRVRFEALQGRVTDYRLYVLLAPHIRNCGYGNSGWAGQYKGVTMLFAQRRGTALALACSTPFKGLSCGYAGVSDGWRDIRASLAYDVLLPSAPDGNIALTGEIDLAVPVGRLSSRSASAATLPKPACKRALRCRKTSKNYASLHRRLASLPKPLRRSWARRGEWL